MSKFLTIDLYIDQTTAVYAPTATQVQKKMAMRAVLEGLEFTVAELFPEGDW